MASARVRDTTMRVDIDEAHFTLVPSVTEAEEYWDYTCTRHVQVDPQAKLRRYVEFVHPGAQTTDPSARLGRLPIELDLNGVTRYEISRGLRRTARVAVRTRGVSSAFESVGLLSRYGGRAVRLSLSRERAGELDPFGSETDLATGRERPSRVEVLPGEWVLRVTDCPPLTLLRIYWPLEC